MNKISEINDVHPIVQAAIDTIDKDPNDHIQWDKPSLAQGMGSVGHADFRILYHGVWIDVECKADMWLNYPVKLSTSRSRLPTAPQCRQLERTEKAGGLALVVDIHTAHSVKDILTRIKRYVSTADDPIRKLHGNPPLIMRHVDWKQFALPKPEVTL